MIAVVVQLAFHAEVDGDCGPTMPTFFLFSFWVESRTSQKNDGVPRFRCQYFVHLLSS